MKKTIIYLRPAAVCGRRSLDASRLSRYFILNNCRMTMKPAEADYILIVTCGFKKSVLNECLNIIESHSKFKGELIILGCLPAIDKESIDMKFNVQSLETKRINEIDKFFPDFKTRFQDVPDANFHFNYADYMPKGILKKKVEDCIKKTKTKLKKRLFWNRGNNKGVPVYMQDYETEQGRGKIPLLRVCRGCLGMCSFCSIRFATGKLESKPVEACLEEYKNLLDKGYRVFTIDSEDVGAYGLDIGTSFDELLKKFSLLDEGLNIELKIHTLNPQWAIRYKKTILEQIEQGKITCIKCDVQSGNHRILKLMNRYNKVDNILKLFKDFRRANPHIYLRSQFIGGFPSETDEEFRDTLKVMDQLDLNDVTLFPYSDNKGTLASRIPNKVPQKDINKRMIYAKNYFEDRGYRGELGEHWLEIFKIPMG